jgi:hypothetical protein
LLILPISEKPASRDAGFFCIDCALMKCVLPALALLSALALSDFLRSKEADSPGDHLLKTLTEVTGRDFSFATVIAETTGRKIITPGPAHDPVMSYLAEVAREVAKEMSRPDSPARQKDRINEVSTLFEDALLGKIESHPEFTCGIPRTREGKIQRSGYPDLRVEHLPSGTVAYLDPKLFRADSVDSSFRTFYYEPSPDRSKVTEDALHLLLGFPHDGRTGAWAFGEPELVDLSALRVTLKAEFSASNKELYLNSAAKDSPRDKE